MRAPPAVPARLVILGLLVLLLDVGTAAAGDAPVARPGASSGDPVEAILATEEVTLRSGQVLVLASWRCSYLQLARVNELGVRLVEGPMERMVAEGRILGWGQLNGEFRDEFNYHTFYVAPSIEEYRRALGAVLGHVGGEGRDDMQEFYRLCDATRELAVTVVTTRR